MARKSGAGDAVGERAPNIRDVAKLARVSTATVSRALASPDRVGAELRQRVAAAVQALSYTPNVAGRILRAGASRMILLDAPHQLANSFFSGLFEGLDDAFTARGYTCIIGSTEISDEKARRLIELAYARQIDGVIALTADVARMDGRSLVDAKIPVVSICVELRTRKAPSVIIDDERWARRQVEHLVQFGHRRLLYVGGVPGNYNDVRRRRGFSRAASAAGIGESQLSFVEGDYTPPSGVEAARAFVARKARATGVVCASDDMAIGFMSFAADAGLSCPQDYSIVGFDGIGYGLFVRPSLTTIVQPRLEMAHAGADLMLRALEGDSPPPETQLVMECELRLGGSTGPAP